MPTGNVVDYGYLAVDDCDKIAAAIVDGWMHSPGHKAIIINRNLKKIGIGIAYDGTKYYATAGFSA